MSKRARQRICYVLGLPNSAPSGHRLGINGLAVDRQNSILYSGGRDGVICAWELNFGIGETARDDEDEDHDDDRAPSAQSPQALDLQAQPWLAGPSQANPKKSKLTTTTTSTTTTQFRGQTQAHYHWINDIAVAQNHSALISASSDLTVKVWRPQLPAHGSAAVLPPPEPVTIGQHADYVKCVATPSQSASWVASGGLDRRLCLWDLNGAGQVLAIDTSGEEMVEKGSIYALSVNDTIVAEGGPECIARLWDPRSGKRITKLVGHTDVVRAILVSERGDTIMTASSDQTVKVWSVTAGRCLHTLTMHCDSVWSLATDTPDDLSVFYSADRSGLIVKTDIRGVHDDMDDALSLAIAQEHDGVRKVVAYRDSIWAATSRSSINRWPNVDTAEYTYASRSRSPPPPPPLPSWSHLNRRPSKRDSMLLSPTSLLSHSRPVVGAGGREISSRSVLKASDTKRFSMSYAKDLSHHHNNASSTTIAVLDMGRKGSDISPPREVTSNSPEPINSLPDETIEGQFGIVKHRILNDRRRVLTLDTAGDVILWDVIQCRPIQSFGKRHLDDVEPEINTLEAVAPWCSIDTSSGNLTVTLDPFNCFDAEVYADELDWGDEAVVLREDQRVNLGQWILRCLFAEFVDEELRRDNLYRQRLLDLSETRIATANQPTPPLSATFPSSPSVRSGWDATDSPVRTPRPTGNVTQYFPSTPSSAKGSAPSPGLTSTAASMGGDALSPGRLNTPADKRPSRVPSQVSSHVSSSQRSSQAKEESATIMTTANSSISNEPPKSSGIPPNLSASAHAATTADDATESLLDNNMESPGVREHERDTLAAAFDTGKDVPKSPAKSIGKRFRMGMTFSSRKLGRKPSTLAATASATAAAAAVSSTAVPVDKVTASAEDKADESESSSNPDSKAREGTIYSIIHRIRGEYEKQLLMEGAMADRAVASELESRLMPTQASDAPPLRLPPQTKIVIQEETSGGNTEVYRGTAASAGADADLIEVHGPLWLGHFLLQSLVPYKEPFKVSFTLQPMDDSLPHVTAIDGNDRLNANRMLRVNKILNYIADRIDPPLLEGKNTNVNVLKPEEYLELYCNDRLLPTNMNLATLRAHIWKGGNDILLNYRANGRKKIHGSRQPLPMIMTPNTAVPPTSAPSPPPPLALLLWERQLSNE